MFEVFLMENTIFFAEELDKQAGTGQGGQQGHPVPRRVWLKAGESLQICEVSPSMGVPIAETIWLLIFFTVSFAQNGDCGFSSKRLNLVLFSLNVSCETNCRVRVNPCETQPSFLLFPQHLLSFLSKD